MVTSVVTDWLIPEIVDLLRVMGAVLRYTESMDVSNGTVRSFSLFFLFGTGRGCTREHRNQFD